MFTMYSKPNCPFCIRAKRLIETETDDELVIIDVEDNPSELRFIKETMGMKTVPVIFDETMDGTFIGGYEALKDYLKYDQ